MYKEKSEDISVLQWLISLFADAPFIKIVSAFPSEDLEIPTISIVSVSINKQNSELGNRTPIKLRTYSIDVFGADETQRDEYAYRIFNALDNPIIIYDYSSGFTNPPELDSYDILETRLRNIPILSALSEKLYYRANVTFVAQLNTLE